MPSLKRWCWSRECKEMKARVMQAFGSLGGRNSLCKADLMWLEWEGWGGKMMLGGPPGPAKSQRVLQAVWRVGGLCSVKYRAHWAPVLWAVRAPPGQENPGEGILVSYRKEKLQHQALGCKCGRKCPSKSATSQWVGQSSRVQSSAELGCMWLKPGGWAQHHPAARWAPPGASEVWQGSAAPSPWECQEAPWSAW